MKENANLTIHGFVFLWLQALKPNILKELAEDQGVPPQPLLSYSGDDDELILEDSLQRIRLRGGSTTTSIRKGYY